ncbi:MAG: polyprenyl synthetase family protein [Verrucomicrobia bacterium]|nr:MAG: polyprenyl synthetase family protein [Verrucomicrobiota bacterium]
MSDASDFKAKLAELQSAIETAIDELLPPAHIRPERLHTAMRYSMQAGGKRLRPALTLAVADLFDRRAAAMPAAIAIECIHTYSLIHDDLPAMDNDDLRRGRPTAHRQFDEATAILAGDALLTYAFELIARHYAQEPALGMRILAELTSAAGNTKLIGGQMADMLAEGRSISPAELTFIHAGKTAALITAAIVIGGFIGGADEEQTRLLRMLGYHLGMAFQVVDDILDATATTAALGKTAGKDARTQKATVVSLFGLDEARRKAKEHTEAAALACSKLPGNAAFLSALVRSLEHRAN